MLLLNARLHTRLCAMGGTFDSSSPSDGCCTMGSVFAFTKS